jgi:hypothetical protein
MSSQWYFARNGQKSGPFSSEQLKQYAAAGKLDPTDNVWKEGMAAWMPAGQLSGLFAATPPAPPIHQAVAVLPSAPTPTPQAISAAAEKPPHAATADRFFGSDAFRSRTATVKAKWLAMTKKQKIVVGVVGFIVLLGIAGLGKSTSQSEGRSSGFSLFSSKPTCKDLLHKVASLQGWDDWQWEGNSFEKEQQRKKTYGKKYETLFVGEIPPPKSFGTYERHTLASNKNINLTRLFEALGEPSQKHADPRHTSNDYGGKKEIWVYYCNDGEVRVPVFVSPKNDPPFVNIYAPGVDVFRNSTTHIFNEKAE